MGLSDLEAVKSVFSCAVLPFPSSTGVRLALQSEASPSLLLLPLSSLTGITCKTSLHMVNSFLAVASQRTQIQRPGTVFMPVIPALWEAEASRSPEVRSLRPAWPTW